MPDAEEHMERMAVLAAEIQARMDELGMTKPMLARQAGVQPAQLTSLLAGRRPGLSRVTLTKVARALMVPPAVLLGRVDGATDVALTAGIGDPERRPAPRPDESPADLLAEQIRRLNASDRRLVEQLVTRLLSPS